MDGVMNHSTLKPKGGPQSDSRISTSPDFLLLTHRILECIRETEVRDRTRAFPPLNTMTFGTQKGNFVEEVIWRSKNISDAARKYQ